MVKAGGVMSKPKRKALLTKAQKLEVKSLVEDSGYRRSEAIKIVLAGGI